MAGIFAYIDSDIKKIERLKSEIEAVKKALASINIKVDIDIAKGLEERLQKLTGQYDALISKIAASDAKIKEAESRMNSAAKRIMEAQQRMSQSATSQGGNGSQTAEGTASANAQTESIKAQAKAYDELANEIDAIMGTRSQNIKRMIEEQNAIRLINNEIKLITKSQEQHSALSSDEQRRLEQLNASLMQHKTALSELRQSLANGFKLDNAAATSMNALSQSLARMRMTYRELSEEERKSPFGRDLLASIQQADAKIKELDATIGNHQRNVGNYSSAFNGLGMSVQQIVRELPAATMGLNMFFLAISNNLPILTDEIKRARDMNEQLKASGQSTVPVWKQLVSSIFSWQTAMMVAITVMSMYGKEIMNWIGNLIKGENELKKIQEEFTEFVKKLNEEWIDSVSRSAGQQIAEYRKLSREYDSLGKNMQAKKKFINDNQEAFRRLGFSVTSVTDAENLFIGNTEAVVKALTARAKAAAYEENITKATQNAIKQKEKNDNTLLERAVGLNGKLYNGDISRLTLEEDYERTYRTIGTGAYARLVPAIRLTQSGAEKVAHQQIEEANKRIDDNLDSLTDRYTKKLGKLLTKSKEELNKAGIKEYTDKDDGAKNPDREAKERAEQARRMADERKKAQSDADKELFALQQKNQDDEISMMRDGTEKKLEEIKNDYKKRIAEIDKQEADFKEKNKEAGLTELDADGLTAEQHKELAKARENAKKDAERQTEEIYRNEAQAMRDYLKEYGTYQQQKLAIAEEYAEKISKAQNEGERLSLEKERDMALQQTEVNAIRQQIDWGSVFGDFGTMFKEQLQPTIDRLRKISESDTFRQSSLEDQQLLYGLIEKLEQSNAVWDSDIFKRVSDDINAYQEAMMRYTEAVEKARIAEENLSKAKSTLDAAKRGGLSQAMINAAQAAVEEAQAAFNAASEEVSDFGTQVQETTSSLNTSAAEAKSMFENLAEGIQGLSSGSMKGIGQGLMALDDLSFFGEKGELTKKAGNALAKGFQSLLGKNSDAAKTLTSALGESGLAGEIISAILGMLDMLADGGFGGIISNMFDTVLGSINGVLDDIFSGGIITKPLKSFMDGLGGILDTVTFGGFSHWGNNAAETKETIDRLMTRNDALIASLDRLNDTIKDSAGAAESVAAAEKAKEYQQEINENYRDAAAAQAHYQGKHRSWSHYFNEWLDMVDYLEDLPEGAFTIFGNRDDDVKTKQKMDEIAGFEIKSRTDFLSITPEQMAEMLADVDIRELIKNIGEGGYGAKMLAALEDYADQAGKIEEIENTLRETLTQISFDSMYDSFIDKLMDMDADAQDFADDFAEYMMRAMLADEVGSLYKDRLQDWYTAFADFMKNKDGLTEDEKNRMLSDLRNEWDDIINEGLATRDELAEVTGYDNTSSSSSRQEASSKGFETMSQDMAGELNGRFTALNETGLRIEAQGEMKVQTLNEIKGSVSEMAAHIQGINNIADETRSILANSYLELQAINDNTAAIVQPIKNIQKDIEQVKQNTSRL